MKLCDQSNVDGEYVAIGHGKDCCCATIDRYITESGC